MAVVAQSRSTRICVCSRMQQEATKYLRATISHRDRSEGQNHKAPALREVDGGVICAHNINHNHTIYGTYSCMCVCVCAHINKSVCGPQKNSSFFLLLLLLPRHRPHKRLESTNSELDSFPSRESQPSRGPIRRI